MAKPAVDGLERDLADRAKVVRLNVADDTGQRLASRYGLSAVPTFIAFRAGQPVARFVGYPDQERIKRALLPDDAAR